MNSGSLSGPASERAEDAAADLLPPNPNMQEAAQ